MHSIKRLEDTNLAGAHQLPAAPAGTVAAIRHTNVFDLLRLGAALLVLFDHAYPLTGNVPPGILGNQIGTIGVKVFFVISGFMIAGSWSDDPRIWAFTVRRSLRIMPALILLTFLTVAILGPLETTLPISAYLGAPGTRNYLWNILLYPVYALPGVFTSNIYPGAVNGSLWSLPAEVLMYCLTPLIIRRTAWKSRIAIVAICVISAVAGLYFVRVAPINPPPVFYGTSLVSVLDVAVYFLLGTLFSVFMLERFARPILASLALTICAVVTANLPGSPGLSVIAELALMMTLPFAIISVGQFQLQGRVGRLLAFPDISYGLYLYGFPVEQAVSAAFHGHVDPQIDFAVALPLTSALALVSWHLVEKTALRLKPRRAFLGVKSA